MKTKLKPDRTQLVWPVAAIVVTFLVVKFLAANPAYTPRIRLWMGVAVWGVGLVLVLVLGASRTGARMAVLMTGLLAVVPCFVSSPPFFRGWLMCFMGIPFVAATLLVLVPPITGFRARLGYLCLWCNARPVTRFARGFDVTALVQLIVATVILDASIAVIMAVPNSGFWMPVRWLAGGITIFAFAEIITACFALIGTAAGITLPTVMQSPWRSTSIHEFWTKRWNIITSQKVFHPLCFVPLARRSVGLAVCVAFAASAAMHILLIFMAVGTWGIALVWGAFFLVQPLLIAVERGLGVRRWRPAAAWAWTMGALAITSPLFVEPMLRVIEVSWGVQNSALSLTACLLGSVVVCTGIVALVFLACWPGVDAVER